MTLLLQPSLEFAAPFPRRAALMSMLVPHLGGRGEYGCESWGEGEDLKSQ